MTHRHTDLCDPTETYGMPSRPCVRCKRECCIDCATRQSDGLLCEHCEWWLSLSDGECKRASR